MTETEAAVFRHQISYEMRLEESRKRAKALGFEMQLMGLYEFEKLRHHSTRMPMLEPDHILAIILKMSENIPTREED